MDVHQSRVREIICFRSVAKNSCPFFVFPLLQKKNLSFSGFFPNPFLFAVYTQQQRTDRFCRSASQSSRVLKICAHWSLAQMWYGLSMTRGVPQPRTFRHVVIMFSIFVIPSNTQFCTSDLSQKYSVLWRRHSKQPKCLHKWSLIHLRLCFARSVRSKFRP